MCCLFFSYGILFSLFVLSGTCKFEHLIPDILEWQAVLLHVNQMMEAVYKCQKIWQYLLPLFTSNDIRLQMVVSAGHFDVCDDELQQVLTNKLTKHKVNIELQTIPLTCIEVAVVEQKKAHSLIDTMQECIVKLETVKNKLHSW